MSTNFSTVVAKGDDEDDGGGKLGAGNVGGIRDASEDDDNTSLESELCSGSDHRCCEAPAAATTATLNLATTSNSSIVILYPAGGHFRVERQKQVFLECLLEDSIDVYSALKASAKKDFIRDNILGRLAASGRELFIHRGPPEKGTLVKATTLEAVEKLGQKLRDRKKRRRQQRLQQQVVQQASVSKPAIARTSPTSVLPPKEQVRGTNKAADTTGKTRMRALPLTRRGGGSTGSNVIAKSQPSPTIALPANGQSANAVSLTPPTVPYDDFLESDAKSRNAKLTVPELKEIIWEQWEQIDQYRRQCKEQKQQIERLQEINRRQHQWLMECESVDIAETESDNGTSCSSWE